MEKKGAELIDTVVIDTVTPWWTAHMAKESLSRYALAPWGMQPNTSLAALSPRSTGAVSRSCLCAYYTIFGNFWVNSCGRRSGMKSILRALASFAAVRKVMLTSW